MKQQIISFAMRSRKESHDTMGHHVPKTFKDGGAIWHYEVQNIKCKSQFFVDDVKKIANRGNPEKSKLM